MSGGRLLASGKAPGERRPLTLAEGRKPPLKN